MVVKRIPGVGRSAAASTSYISDSDRAGESDQSEELKGHGPKVVAAGTLATTSDDWHTAAREVHALEAAYHGRGQSTDHIVLSWQADEKPTRDQMAVAVAVAMRHAGYEDRPAVWTAHGDTANLHIHIVVSRIEPDDRGRLSIPDGRATIQTNRKHDNISESLHVAAAELCRDQDWSPEPNARYGPDLKRSPAKPQNPNALNLSGKVYDSEAFTGKEHPSHTLALAAVPILRAAKSWPEAKESLAAQGINIQVKTFKNGGLGAVLTTPLGTRAKLSSLPADCSLKNLDQRFGKLGPPLTTSLPGPKPSLRAAVQLAVATAARKAQPGRAWTPAQAKNQFKRIVNDSVDWTDILHGLKREGWHLARSGKSGALLVAGDDPKLRIKLSDIGRGFSYGKLSEKFENTLEGQVKKCDLISAVVTYRVTSPKIAYRDVTQQDPNASRPPTSITDDEALTGDGHGLAATGGRIALSDGRKIPLSQLKPGLAVHRARKSGDGDELVNAREKAKRDEASEIIKQLRDEEARRKRAHQDARGVKAMAIKEAQTKPQPKAALAAKVKADQQAGTQEQQQRQEKERKERELLVKERELFAKIRSQSIFRPSPSKASKDIDNINKLLHENFTQHELVLQAILHNATVEDNTKKENLNYGY